MTPPVVVVRDVLNRVANGAFSDPSQRQADALAWATKEGLISSNTVELTDLGRRFLIITGG